jgi:PPOX class probable F420-dependent enzyme
MPMARLGAGPARRLAGGALDAAHTGSLDQIRRHRHSLLITYRRDGTAVPTPAWAADANGKLYVRSERGSGKVKRLRRDSRMLVAPCTVAGTPRGAPLEAHARVLLPAEEPLAERALASRFGWGRELFELSMDLLRVDMCYLEITPAKWGATRPADAAAGTPAA